MESIAMSRRKIILDCDPGHDDAIAILMALASPEKLDLLGLTCVGGNVSLDMTSKNALKVCELAGFTDTAVHSGCERPMIRQLSTAENVHGKSGLDLPGGTVLPEPTMSLRSQHAVDFIIGTLMTESTGSITLCPTGPLTNIAMAMIREPEIIPRIQEIVFMGGSAINPGNTTPAAEFNIYVDPHAAHVVLSSGVKLVMMGLDVTHQVQVTPSRLQTIKTLGRRVSETVADLIRFYGSFDLEQWGMEGAALHDPCVIAYLLDKDMFTLKHVNVEVETNEGLTLGETVADWKFVTDRPLNCHVAYQADADRFFELLNDRLLNLP
jgi:purine nucleosidase|tara:strand:- start:1218 stop:2186 length:969 start_codon:yes stop_codon:yes gene_type:complete